MAVRAKLRSGKVRAVLEDWSIPAIDLWAVFPTGRRASAKARAFEAFIEDRLFQGASVRTESAQHRTASTFDMHAGAITENWV
jgi:hypothetical protein